MKRKWIIILAALTCIGLTALIPVGMQVWAISVLKEESRMKTLRIAWKADRYGARLVKASVVKDAKWHPVVITLLGEPHDAQRLARAIPWMKHVYSIKMQGAPSSAALLCDAASRLPRLSVLEVSDTVLDSATLAGLSRMERLRALHIRITPDTVMSLPALPELRQLRIVSPEPLTAVHLQKLLASPQLLTLYIDQAPVTLSDLAAVNWKHATLTRVELPEMRVATKEMQALVQRMKSQAPRLELVRGGLGNTYYPIP